MLAEVCWPGLFMDGLTAVWLLAAEYLAKGWHSRAGANEYRIVKKFYYFCCGAVVCVGLIQQGWCEGRMGRQIVCLFGSG